MSKWDGILINGNRFEDEYNYFKFEWDRRHPHSIQDGLLCINCLHSNCSHCGDLKYPIGELFVGIGE